MSSPYATTSDTTSRWGVRRWLAGAARWLTTPLTPDDYLRLVNPLWPAGGLCGRVEAVRSETSDAVTLVIRPGRHWVPHRPGQWVRVGVDIAGVRHWRGYSISSPPDRPDGCITITVKAVPGGLVSGHLLRRVARGTILGLGRPEGEFVLPEPPPSRLLFLTAGSGITPVRPMLHGLLAHGAATVAAGAGSRRRAPDVVLVHSAPTPEDVIFGEELRGLAARFPNLRLHERHTRTEGRLKPADLPGLCPDWTERSVWACGPPEMLDEVTAHWSGPADRLHVERFRLATPATSNTGGRVRFTRSRREATADGGTSLLVAGEGAGVLMPSGCRMGICHGCVARLSSGRVRDLRTGRIHGEEGDLVQTCVSAAAGPVEIDL
ncbi:Ferredoxin-NADP reductase [Thermomonospora echinospora]|uniref:Ferredoxin-NADP reductase n=1 Tax=Thermomonospora echinospora TaxID=1992 RepID=A0A1H5YM59_9ACTN|nr:ferredoxin reductase [Thermomonospora echinospora]SEG24587.1 Ferredoxin-NADP reductase [Thermomonospora echinospora]